LHKFKEKKCIFKIYMLVGNLLGTGDGLGWVGLGWVGGLSHQQGMD
jgi:hypothetical protein